MSEVPKDESNNVLPRKMYDLKISKKQDEQEEYHEPDGFKVPLLDKKVRRVTISEERPLEIKTSNFTAAEYLCKTNPNYRGGRRSRYSTFISGIDQFDPYQELTAMQIAAFRQVFDMVDKDGGGSIDAEELYNSMKDLESNLNLDEIKEILEELDRDGNGEIDFEEFLYMMTSMSIQIKEAQAEEVHKNNEVKRRQSIFFSVITKFAMKHSLKEIERYYASKVRYAPHVVGHYAAGARVVGLTDRELRRTWKNLSAASKGMDSPYAQPLNFVISSNDRQGYQKKTIGLKKHKTNNDRARITPSPNMFDSRSSKLHSPSTYCNHYLKNTSKKPTKIGWTPRHRLPITQVGLPVVTYNKKKLNVSEMDKIRERVTQAKNSYYTKLSNENEEKAQEYWDTLKINEIESDRLQVNFELAFRAYSPTNEHENHILNESCKIDKQRKSKRIKENLMTNTVTVS